MVPQIESLITQKILTRLEPIRTRPETLPTYPSVQTSRRVTEPQKIVDSLKLDPNEVLTSSRKRWIEGEAIPDTAPLAQIPSAVAWLDRHKKYLHESDVRRLRLEVESVWCEGYGGTLTVGQTTSLRKRIVAILCEIHMRPWIIDAYRKAHDQRENTILLVEGEMRDGKECRPLSDALIAALHPETQNLELIALYEIAADPRSNHALLKSKLQHTETMDRRLLQNDLLVLDSENRQARFTVSVGIEEVDCVTLMPSSEDLDTLRRDSSFIAYEILAWTTLRRLKNAAISQKDLRKYRLSLGKSSAGMFAEKIWDEIWNQFQTLRAQDRIMDIRWVVFQVRERLPILPSEISKILDQRLACLVNVSEDLNLSGTRVSITKISKDNGILHPVATRYTKEAVKKLIATSCPVLKNPHEESSRALRGAVRAKRIIQGIWAGQSSAVGVSSALSTTIVAESDKETLVFLKAYLSCLINVSSDLNSAGARKSALQLASGTDVTQPVITKYQSEIEKHLRDLSAAVIPDPQAHKGRMVTVGKDALDVFRRLWNPQNSLTEICQALDKAIKAPQNERIQQKLKIYRACLWNVSATLNTTGIIVNDAELARRNDVKQQKTIARYREIVKKLLSTQNERAL